MLFVVTSYYFAVAEGEPAILLIRVLYIHMYRGKAPLEYTQLLMADVGSWMIIVGWTK